MAQAQRGLTDMAQGGGCGCKLSPAVLADLLKGMPQMAAFPDLLVGTESSDDAAVWRISDELALISTTDFFMPIVDNPRDFGRIAAANALSDIYAMGGTPLMALALVGMPVAKLGADVIREILEGGASICAEAGIPVAGGHSIDSSEPIYGLAVTGMVHPARLKRNSGARAGDVLILSKPLGIGILGAALRGGTLDAAAGEQANAALVATATQLNKVGSALAMLEGVHAMTDVTGFGLLGHALEMCRGAGLGARIEAGALPLLPGVEQFARDGIRTGAATRNWASYGHEVSCGADLGDWQRDIACDPQTSGGLLIACAAEVAWEVLGALHNAGFGQAAAIGAMGEGKAGVHLA